MQNHVSAMSADNQRLILDSHLHTGTHCQHSVVRRHCEWPKTSASQLASNSVHQQYSAM